MENSSNIQDTRSQESKSKSIPTIVSNGHLAPQSFQVIDNRYEAVLQRKIQEVFMHSNKSKQLKAYHDKLRNIATEKQQPQENPIQLKRVSKLTRLTRANVNQPWTSTTPGTPIDDDMRHKVMIPLKTMPSFKDHVGGHLIQESMGGSGAFADGNILPWSRNFEEGTWTANVDRKIQQDLNRTARWSDVYMELVADYDLAGQDLSARAKKKNMYSAATLSAIEYLPVSVRTSWGIGRVEDLETLEEDGDEYDKDKYSAQIGGGYSTNNFNLMHGVDQIFFDPAASKEKVHMYIPPQENGAALSLNITEDTYAAIEDIANDKGIEETDELKEAFKNGGPYSSKEEIVAVLSKVIPKKPNAVEYIAEYIIDNYSK